MDPIPGRSKILVLQDIEVNEDIEDRDQVRDVEPLQFTLTVSKEQLKKSRLVQYDRSVRSSHQENFFSRSKDLENL
jgi:hypothetical protein